VRGTGEERREGTERRGEMRQTILRKAAFPVKLLISMTTWSVTFG
jgi:hypothetical protein